jgi:hypothetical protein
MTAGSHRGTGSAGRGLFCRPASVLRRWRRMAPAAAMVFGFASAAASDAPADNATVFTAACDSAALACANCFAPAAGDTLGVSCAGPADEVAQFCLTRICGCFLGRGVTLVSGAPRGAGLLTFTVTRAFLEYRPIPGNARSGGKKVLRRAVVEFTGRLEPADGGPVLARTFAFSGSDSLETGDLDRIEYGVRLPAPPRRPGSTGVRKWAEPVAALVATGLTMYGFFSIRSK